MIGPSHPARDDVLAAMELVQSTLGSPDVQGADALALVVAKRMLQDASDKLRASASVVTSDCPVVPIRRPIGLSGVKCW